MRQKNKNTPLQLTIWVSDFFSDTVNFFGDRKNSNVSEMFFEQTSPMLIEPTLTFNEESLSLFPLQPSQTLVLIKLSIHLLIPKDWVWLYLL